MTIPVSKNNRITIYFDESGVSSLKDQGRFFILTGVIANNSEFAQLSEYYFRLKLKYFKEEAPIHSVDLFWNKDEKIELFIKELVEYLETIQFGFLTVVVDKERVLESTPLTNPNNPFLTTFSEAKSIWQKKGLTTEKFKEKTIEEILEIVRKYKFPNINNYYPLKISYYTLLKKYLNEYAKRLEIDNCEFEICFETSPNRERIIRYTEEFYEERKKGNPKEKTNFAVNLKNHVYSISFPNKSAKYLGLEIADIVSYGFSLSRYKRINKAPLYKDVWDIISKRRTDIKRDFKFDCLEEISKRKIINK